MEGEEKGRAKDTLKKLVGFPGSSLMFSMVCNYVQKAVNWFQQQAQV